MGRLAHCLLLMERTRFIPAGEDVMNLEEMKEGRKMQTGEHLIGSYKSERPHSLYREFPENVQGKVINDEDWETIQRIVDGRDSYAFDKLMIKYQDKVRRLARSITRSEPDTEDVVQDVFLAVFKKLPAFEGRSTFSSWLYRITANASYMKLRSRKNMRTYEMEEIDYFENNNDNQYILFTSGNPEEVVGSNEMVNSIDQEIGRLPEKYRIVLNLRDIDEFNLQEVADMIGLKVSAVKSRLHRARLILRKKLGKMYDAEVKGCGEYKYDTGRSTISGYAINA